MPQVKSKLVRRDGSTAEIVANIEPPKHRTQSDRDAATAKAFNDAIAARQEANKVKPQAKE